MNSLKRGIVDIIKVSLTGHKVTVGADFNWNVAYYIFKAHQILPLLYYGAIDSDVNLPSDFHKQLKSNTIQYVYADQNQLYEISQIEKLFNESEIDYMLLKGASLKHLYPKTEHRSMGDADILIRTWQYEKIKPIMRQLGYEEVLESNHELIWEKKGILTVELHKMLIPSYNKDYYAYFGDGWKLAQKKDGFKYEMKDEDQFIYLFTHYAKHYRDAGIGIRHFIDFYVFLCAKSNLDWDYINGELKNLQLLDFCKNTLETLSVWFDGKPDSEMSDFITDHIFRSGAYGTYENHLLSDGLKTSKSSAKSQVKREKMIELIFPTATTLSSKYTILKKMPFLLPFFWIYRLSVAVLFKQKKIIARQKEINMMSAANISAYQDELNFVGLDFNFGE